MSCPTVPRDHLHERHLTEPPPDDGGGFVSRKVRCRLAVGSGAGFTDEMSCLLRTRLRLAILIILVGFALHFLRNLLLLGSAYTEGLRKMCQAFQDYAPVRLAEVGEALRERDAPRLRQAAHKFSALLFAFSTDAGNVASELEGHAAQGQLDQAKPLVERLQTMTQELMRLAGSLTLETLRQQAQAANDRQSTTRL